MLPTACQTTNASLWTILSYVLGHFDRASSAWTTGEEDIAEEEEDEEGYNDEIDLVMVSAWSTSLALWEFTICLLLLNFASFMTLWQARQANRLKSLKLIVYSPNEDDERQRSGPSNYEGYHEFCVFPDAE